MSAACRERSGPWFAVAVGRKNTAVLLTGSGKEILGKVKNSFNVRQFLSTV